MIAPHQWHLAGHGILEDHHGTPWDDSSQFMYVDLEARWRDAPPLSYRLTFQVTRSRDLAFILDFEMYPVEQVGPTLEKLLLALPEAIIKEDLVAFANLLATPEDARWYVKNRFPRDLREEFPQDGYTQWGSALYFDHDLGGYFGSVYDRRQALPAEVVFLALGEVALEDINADGDLRSHELEYHCHARLADGSTVPLPAGGPGAGRHQDHVLRVRARGRWRRPGGGIPDP